MFWFWEILYFVLFLVALPALYTLAAIVLNWLFNGDRFFGPIPENQIIRLDLNGTLYRFVSNVRGPHGKRMWANPKNNYQMEVTPNMFFWSSPLNYLVWRITGLHKLSWNPFVKVAWYQYRWPALLKPKQDDGPGRELEVVWRDELVRSIFYVYDYPIFAKDIEVNSSSYTVDFLLMTRMRITNPFTVSVTNQPTGVWIQREIGDIIERLSAYVFPLRYEELRKQQEKGGESGLASFLKDPIFTEQLRAKFGADIDNVDWPTLTVPHAIEESLRLKADAQIKNEVLTLNAEAYKTAVNTRTEADVNRDEKLFAIRAANERTVAVTQANASVESAKELRKFKGQVLSINASSPLISLPLAPSAQEAATQE